MQYLYSKLLNASPWITEIEENQIESRRLIANQMIIDAVMPVSPTTVLDMVKFGVRVKIIPPIYCCFLRCP